ncbi:STAS domain-containing protein [Sediminibacterium ginsengisoli]|uniref:Anti-anti-sigma factor n=1 Tax=Sediminibacterium ginsengisoli TaxID=413434 RepID=A0A1T4LI35_9BACT|nr:STAS domain-containing protein [Sediminibacterium ginsengisoli]SJZ54278.1 anti-anti-sigma factor [Sediminibacterium ginsengisoli]
MEVKIDTKEKFTVVTPMGSPITDNIAATIANNCKSYLQNDVKNVILNLSNVTSLEEKAAETLASLQQDFYEQSVSFVICCLQPEAEDVFEKAGVLDMLNVTPTESEAWDIVQMEEIERELLDGDDITFEQND